MALLGLTTAQTTFAIHPSLVEITRVDEDFPILLLDGGKSTWTIKNAFEGTQIFGTNGSGKTSGSGRTIARNFLKSGMGGLVLTAKPDEAEEWKKYATAEGRSDDIIILGQNSEYSFGFFEYERKVAQAAKLPVTETVVNLFSILLEVSNRKSSGSQDAYWILAVRQLVRNAVDLLLYSDKQLSFGNLYSVITSAPSSKEAAEALEDAIHDKTGRKRGLFGDCLEIVLQKTEPDSTVQMMLAYFLDEFPSLDPEPRSCIVSYFSSIADVFSRGILKKLFSPSPSANLDFFPELSREGKILIIDLPVKHFNETGQLAQVLYKYIWQRAAERQAGSRTIRPMFLWADESQFFCNSGDFLFQTTARSSKVATVYLTQNISNYYATMPGDKAKAETDSLLGNFNTKIFHANNDSVTNTWASELIARDWQFRESIASSVSSSVNNPSKQLFSIGGYFQTAGDGTSTNVNRSKNEVLEYQVLPLSFTSLLKGGKTDYPGTDRVVTAYFTQTGCITGEGRNFQILKFHQEGRP